MGTLATSILNLAMVISQVPETWIKLNQNSHMRWEKQETAIIE